MKRGKIILICILLAVMLQGSAFAESKTSGFEYEVLDDGTACITKCTLSGDIQIPGVIDGYTVSTLTDELFYNRYGITSVRVPASVTRLGKNNDGSNEFAYVFSYCRSLQRIDVDEKNPALCSVDGVLYSKNLSTLFNYPCAKTDFTYHISEKTTRLDCTSLAAAKNLTTLYIDGYDTNWAGFTFYDDGHMTVYYKEGGKTHSAVSVDDYLGHTSEYGPYPTFVIYGEIKPEPEAEEGELGYPNGLKVERIDNSLKLTWQAAQNADRYAIRRQIDDSLVLYEPYARTTELFFVDTDIQWGNADVLYHYWIEAERSDDQGRTTERKTGREVFYVSFPQVKKLTGTVQDDDGVTLNWEKTDYDLIKGYEIYYTLKEDQPDLNQEPSIRVDKTEINLTGLEKGKTYYFYVRPYRIFWGSYELHYLHEEWSEALVLQISSDPKPQEDETEIDGLRYRLDYDRDTATVIGGSKKKVNIPATIQVTGKTFKVTEIGSEAFMGSRLTSVSIGKNIKKIGKKAFSGCTGLVTVSGGNNVTEIDDGAFQKCSGMKKITIGSKVKKIGKNAFQGCKKLSSVIIKTKKLTEKNVGDGAFQGIHSKAVITVAKGKLKKYKTMLMKKGIKKTMTVKD